MLNNMETQALIAGAKQARETAYAPYSRYKVGAAVVTEEGYVFFGNNVENASYGLSLCAERSAISSAIVAGACKIIAIVLVTEAKPPGTPCGACRQWLAEFGGEDLEVICANVAGQTVHTTLGKLLPNAFRL